MARNLLSERLGAGIAAPEAMIGSMAAIPLPESVEDPLEYGRDPMQDRLLFDHKVEVPLIHWPLWPFRLVRISAQQYNAIADYERLSDALERELRA